jgi:hypothetical protein
MVIEEESAHVPSATQELKRDVGAIEHVKKGEKLVPMDEHYVDEFLAHMKPIEGVTSIASKGTRLASRMILNSPAFAAIQAVQEGVPMAAALSRDVRHIPQAIKNLKAASKLDPDELAAFKAASWIERRALRRSLGKGALGRRLSRPGEDDGPETRLEIRPASLERESARPVRQAAGQVSCGSLGMEARVIGDLEARLQGLRDVWRHSTNNLFKDMEGAAKEMRGMTPDERHAYISEHPELQDRIQRSADGMAGNWNSFTVFEKHFAPLTVFYTFQRYSALWMLYHFPLDHPVVATALTATRPGQREGASEAGGRKGRGTQHPRLHDAGLLQGQRGKGGRSLRQTVLPRSLDPPDGSAITGNPSTLIGELPPWLAVPVEAATGKNSYTGRDIEENLLTFMGKQALNLNPAARLFLGLTGSRTAASEAFHEQDPLSEWRSVVDPYIGQTGEQFGNTKKLEKDFATKYGEGKIPSAFDSKAVTELLFESPNGTVDPLKLQALIKKIHESEEASGSIKQVEAESGAESSDFTEEQKKPRWKRSKKPGRPGRTAELRLVGSKSTNPFSQAVGKSSASKVGNPFSQALSEGQQFASGNPFSGSAGEMMEAPTAVEIRLSQPRSQPGRQP